MGPGSILETTSKVATLVFYYRDQEEAQRKASTGEGLSLQQQLCRLIKSRIPRLHPLVPIGVAGQGILRKNDQAKR